MTVRNILRCPKGGHHVTIDATRYHTSGASGTIGATRTRDDSRSREDHMMNIGDQVTVTHKRRLMSQVGLEN